MHTLQMYHGRQKFVITMNAIILDDTLQLSCEPLLIFTVVLKLTFLLKCINRFCSAVTAG